jgi:hypothetical protein
MRSAGGMPSWLALVIAVGAACGGNADREPGAPDGGAVGQGGMASASGSAGAGALGGGAGRGGAIGSAGSGTGAAGSAGSAGGNAGSGNVGGDSGSGGSTSGSGGSTSGSGGSAGGADAGSVDTCSLPAETGPCLAAMRRFYYDPVAARCREFTYGGCGGNANNFMTLADCEAKCAHRAD